MMRICVAWGGGTAVERVHYQKIMKTTVVQRRNQTAGSDIAAPRDSWVVAPNISCELVVPRVGLSGDYHANGVVLHGAEIIKKSVVGSG